MAGVTTETGGGSGRRAVDSEINMIPMIDLLVCCISFLLITAVWSHMSRMNADAQVPGTATDGPQITQPPDKVLHVEMRGEDRFTLVWKQGPTVVNWIDVTRRIVETSGNGLTTIRYPDFATQVSDEWKKNGSHRDSSDKKLDQAVLHTSDKTPIQRGDCGHRRPLYAEARLRWSIEAGSGFQRQLLGQLRKRRVDFDLAGYVTKNFPTSRLGTLAGKPLSVEP